MKKILIVAAVLVIAIVALRLLRPSDRTRIVKTLTTSVASVESESLDKLMSTISLTYRDQLGLAYLPLRRVFSDMFRELDNIKVGCTIVDIAIRGDTADAVLDVWATGAIQGQRCRIIGSSGSPERITVTLAKGEVKWAIVGSRWETLPTIEGLMDRQYLQSAVPR